MQQQINNIEKEVVGLKKDVGYIKEKVGSNKIAVVAMSEDLKEFIQNSPELFASKLSEKIVYGLVGVIVLAVVTALVAGVVSALDYVKTL